MMALRPNGPRPKLDISLPNTSGPTSTNNLNRTNSQSSLSQGGPVLPAPLSLFGSTSTARSPSEPPRFKGRVPTLREPDPHRKTDRTSVTASAHIHGGILDGRRPPSSFYAPEENAATIHAGETYSPEFRPPNPERRPSLSINNVHHSQDLSNKLDPVRGIKDVIDRLSIADSLPNSDASAAYRGSSPDPDSSRGNEGVSNPSFDIATSQFGDPSPTSQDDRVAGMSNHSSASPTQKKVFSDENFDIVSRLGEGAGGAVHKVTDRRDGATYARKTITTRDSTSIRQVMRELNIIAGSRHRNIVLCYGVYMSPSSSEVKIIMEFCDGKSLEAIGAKLKEVGAVMGEKPAGRIAEGILQGLAYLHTRRTVHRDIKPSNILLSREGVVKLCDFGVSGELVNSIVGTFTGTLLYMAPERASGGRYNARSDVWSTGISLLELVQNRFPFPSDLPPMEVVLMIRTGEPPKLEDDPSSQIKWSPEMKDFIQQTLIKDGDLRPTPKEMLEHPWITTIMQQEVNMARWIRQVWGWARPRGRRRNTTEPGKDPTDSSRSRPSTSGSR